MNLIFVQLPVMEPNWEDDAANVPLAAGYLSAYAESQGLLTRQDWEILPKELGEYGSDSALIEYLISRAPDRKSVV